MGSLLSFILFILLRILLICDDLTNIVNETCVNTTRYNMETLTTVKVNRQYKTGQED